MTRDEILDSVEEQEKKLAKSLNQTDEELEFLDDFITTTRFQGVKNLINIGITDFLIAYITSSSKKDFNEIYKVLNNNRNFIDNVSQDGICIMGTLLQTISEFMRRYDLDINKFNKKERKELNQALKKFIDEKLNIYKEKLDMIELSQLYSGIEDTFDDGVRVLVAIKDMIESNAALTEKISNYAQKYGAKTKKKAEVRYRERELSSGYKMDEINKCIDKIIKYCDKKERQNKTYIRKINKQLKSYKEFKKVFIEECKNKEITKVRELVERISDDTLRKEVLYFINDHNNEYYKEVMEEYNIISSDSNNRIKTILNDYHIEFNDDDLINIESSSDLEFELSLLIKMDITESNTLLSIVTNTHKEIVYDIYRIIKEGIIDNSFVNNHINLFNKDLVVSDYPKLIENIDLLKENGINPKMISKTQELFIMDPFLLDKNLKILDSYKLKDKLKKAETYTFFLQENLASTIDSILELGLGNHLKDSLDLLNTSNIGIKRIRLLKELGEELNLEDIRKVVCDKEFFIPDNLLDEYIFNKVDYIHEEHLTEINEETLAKYIEGELTYNFDGVIISKNKVKRNTNNYKDNIFKGIIKNSILNDVEVDTIINCLQTQKVKKVSVKSFGGES